MRKKRGNRNAEVMQQMLKTARGREECRVEIPAGGIGVGGWVGGIGGGGGYDAFLGRGGAPPLAPFHDGESSCPSQTYLKHHNRW